MLHANSVSCVLKYNLIISDYISILKQKLIHFSFENLYFSCVLLEKPNVKRARAFKTTCSSARPILALYLSQATNQVHLPNCEWIRARSVIFFLYGWSYVICVCVCWSTELESLSMWSTCPNLNPDQQMKMNRVSSGIVANGIFAEKYRRVSLAR